MLWKWAHKCENDTGFIYFALEELLNVITVTAREHVRNEYVMKCVEELTKNQFVLPSMWYLHRIVLCVGKRNSFLKPHKQILSNLTRAGRSDGGVIDMVKVLCDNLGNSIFANAKGVICVLYFTFFCLGEPITDKFL